MKNKETEGAIVYRASGESEWLPIGKSSDDPSTAEEKIRRDRDRLLRFLQTSLQMHNLVVLAGSGCSIGAGGPSMADLWEKVVGNKKEFEALAGKLNWPDGNENLEELLSRIESHLTIHNDEEAEDFLCKSRDIILHECSTFCVSTRLAAHETFLSRLSRRRARDPRLKIFTTNYDLCFERAAANLGLVVLDGFSFASPRRFDPRYFSYDIVRRASAINDASSFVDGVFLLHKLHGSVDWERDDDDGITVVPQPATMKACLIHPAAGKYQHSYSQPFLESISQYLAVLREPNTCLLVIGFGFHDQHLTGPLLAAVNANPHLRVVVVDPAARNNEKGENWSRLFELSKMGRDTWFINANFESFAKLLPDMKALSPAEDLFRAVREVVTAS